MNSTKRKILEHALHIFNEYGFYNASLRQIALSIGISQGNLNYHFKTKGEILEVLYFELVEEMEVEISKMSSPESLMHMLFESSKISMTCLYSYRFFMKDLHKIMQENEVIKSHYNQLHSFRTTQFNKIFENLVSQEILRPAEFEDEYNRLYLRMNIVGDNWINTQDLLNNEIKNPVSYYNALLFEMIYPYLTPKGKTEFNEVIGECSHF